MNYSNPDITYIFTEEIPPGFPDLPLLLSGPASAEDRNKEYILVNCLEYTMKVYEIRYPSFGGPYKAVVYFNNMLAVGHYQFFYLFDLTTNTNILRSGISGYFGKMYIHGDRLYFTDARFVYCLNEKGEIAWKSECLAIDGVYIGDFTAGTLIGRCQLDPPDGWEDFTLQKETGQTVKQPSPR